MIIGIDATRNRSGGAIAHIIGIINNFNPENHKIDEIHLWSYQELLDKIPDFPWLTKHSPKNLSKNILFQLYWQRFKLQNEAKSVGCNIMFDSDAGSISKFKPYVTMSQDLLKFEEGSIENYKYGFARLRLFLLYYIQKTSFKNSSGTIFLTNYSSKIIQNHTGILKNFKIIPHGIDEKFEIKHQIKKSLKDNRINILYISPIQEYKNHIPVIDAIISLSNDYNLTVTFAGDSNSNFGRNVVNYAANCDKERKIINFVGSIPHPQLPDFQVKFDIIIFASSVENMPITLIESMKLGMPIACSNKGPMPEVLKDAGVYFDPNSPESIKNALMEIINDDKKRLSIAQKGKKYSREYTWERCSFETFKYLEECAMESNQ